MSTTVAANFLAFAEACFGPDSIDLDSTITSRNNITGALATTGQFGIFAENLRQRFERLNEIYLDHADRKHLLDTVANLARKSNWEGAYAELVAYDFFNGDKDWLISPVGLSKDCSASETLAGMLGMTDVNHDGCYDDFNVRFDVKTFKDKINDMLANAITAGVKRAGSPQVTVEPEYPLDMDFVPFASEMGRLIGEISAALEENQVTFFKSSVIPGLSFRLLRGAGVVTSVSCYDAYLHARNHHTLLFQHAKKFSVVSPSLIVFVVFPWFSESALGSGWGNEAFYRAFCRRFFCQYIGDGESAGHLLGKPLPRLSLEAVTRALSGVIFLEDHSINNGIKEGIHATRGFAYLNPNADHKVGSAYRQHLKNLDVAIDDFGNDNY